jgi:hypothetical protein
MASIIRVVLAMSIILVIAPVVLCQGDAPKAELRVNEDPKASADEKYYIEVKADVPLKDSVYRALGGDKPPQIGVLISKKQPVPASGSFRNLLRVSPADNGTRTLFRMYLPDSMAPFANLAKKNFSIILTNLYVDSADEPQIRAISVDRVLSRDLATDYPVCRRNQFGMSVTYDATDAYSRKRATQLYEYLEALRNDPSKLKQVNIRVEPLTQKQVESLFATHITIAPAKKTDLAGLFSACFATDSNIPSEKFDAELLLTKDAPDEFAQPNIVTGLSGISAEANAVVFPDKEKAVGIRPIDKDLNIAVSLVSSVKDVEQPDKTTLRQRNTIGTLDLRVGLFRDVTQLTVRKAKAGVIEVKKFCGPVTAFSPATAITAGAVEFAGDPFGIAPGQTLSGVIVGAEQCLHFKYLSAGKVIDHNPGHPEDPIFPPFMSLLEPPDTTAGTYNIFTPFYFDAKVSNGKITEDTSSLNRVVFGLQDELRYYTNNNHFPTYFRFIFQGNHASDRDFKQREFKGTFEFRPVLGPLNHPFDPLNAGFRRRELCPDCKPPYKLLPIRYGFEFVPVIGAEIGKTYWRHRPAEALKPSDTVRRLYFGLDATIYPTPRWSLTASEVFYLRGESKTDRQHNYFLGESSYRLSRFDADRISHSVYFSWERGGQPPFDDPDVNVLKVGYRITGTTVFSRFR